jgi:hypothetical protein
VEVLDRLFLLQHLKGRLCLPRNLDVTADLAEEERLGKRYLVRANFPYRDLGSSRIEYSDTMTTRLAVSPPAAPKERQNFLRPPPDDLAVIS